METRNGDVELDLQFGREAQPGLEFSLIGQDVLDNPHRGFLPDFLSSQPTEVSMAG